MEAMAHSLASPWDPATLWVGTDPAPPRVAQPPFGDRAACSEAQGQCFNSALSSFSIFFFLLLLIFF